MVKHVSRLLLTAFFLFFPLSAAATLINFDTLSDSEAVTNQFADFFKQQGADCGVWVNEFEFPPRSGLNVVFDDGGRIRNRRSGAL